MITDQELIERSRNLAKRTLESTIVTLAVTLGVDISTLDSDFIIPVDSDDVDYKSYVALKNMCVNLEKLQ